MAFHFFLPHANFHNELAMQLVINEPPDCWGIGYDLSTSAIDSNLPMGWYAWPCGFPIVFCFLLANVVT
jgi:hypothetical protein